jgi:subtilisin family serine protease
MGGATRPGDRFELRFCEPLKPGDYKLPSIDPKLEAALEHRQDIDSLDVFVISTEFPFSARNGKVEPILPGLEPGFVVRDDGEIYSRERAPEHNRKGKHKYLFAATVHLKADGDPRRILANDLMRDKRIEDVQAAPTLRRQLEYSLPEIGIKIAKPPREGQGPRVDQARELIDKEPGVIVGVVDYGCDFAHRNFRKTGGGTRLLYLWDQNDMGDHGPQANPPPEVRFGRELDRSGIDQALLSSDPYQALAYDPDENDYQPHNAKSLGAHGTHVMDIAAGNGRGTGVSGIAPTADLIFVQIRKFEFGSGDDLNRSRWAFEAAAYIFARAGERPAVVNLSLDTNSGPHDGTSPVEQAFEWLLAGPKQTSRSGRAIVVAAGNNWQAALHCNGTLKLGEERELTWQLPADRDCGRHELQIWYDAVSVAGTVEVVLTGPDDKELPPVSVGQCASIRENGRHIGEITGARHIRDQTSQIFVSLESPGKGVGRPGSATPVPAGASGAQSGTSASAGQSTSAPPAGAGDAGLRPSTAASGAVAPIQEIRWRITLRARSNEQSDSKPGGNGKKRASSKEQANSKVTDKSLNRIEFHGFIERNDRGQSRFAIADAVKSCTLGSLACGRRVIAAAAYYAVLPNCSLGFFSSEGPTRDGRYKPDISAPGTNVWAALSKGDHPGLGGFAARVSKSGTSMAAPHVTGVAALALEQAHKLSIDDIRSALQKNARRDPPDGKEGWHPRYGFGRLALVRRMRRNGRSGAHEG